MMAPQYRTVGTSFGAAPMQFAGGMAPQYGIMPQYGAPMLQPFAAPQPIYAAPQFAVPQQLAAVQTAARQSQQLPAPAQQFQPRAAQAASMQSKSSNTPPPVAPVQSAAAPAATPAVPDVAAVPAASSAPTQAVAAPSARPFVPTSSEMLQVTVLGVKGNSEENALEGNATVTIEVHSLEGAPKHTFHIETTVLTGQCLKPKSTITYIKPGDMLQFFAKQGETELGSQQVFSEDFYPDGFEGDVPIGNDVMVAVKLSCLGQNGQIEQLAPVFVKGTQQTAVDLAPVIAKTSAPRLCSPEEFQWACQQPGAPEPLAIYDGEIPGAK